MPLRAARRHPDHHPTTPVEIADSSRGLGNVVTATAPQVTPEDGAPTGGPLGVSPALTQFVQDLTSAALTKRALFERLADTARELVRAEGSAVLEMEGHGYRVIGPSGTAVPLDGFLIPIKEGESLFREVISMRRARYSNDSQADPRINAQAVAPLHVRHLAVAPIILEGAVVGLLGCANAVGDGFSPADLALLEHLAAHAALVMRGQQLVEQAQLAAVTARNLAEDAARAARANAILARTAELLTNADNSESLFRIFGGVLREELRAGGYAVYDANPRLRIVRLEHQEGIGHLNRNRVEADFWKTECGSTVERGTPAFVEAIDPEPQPDDPPAVLALRASNVEALALLPFHIDERVRGLLVVRFPAPRTFDDDERQLLDDLSNQFALAFRNTLQVDELERRAQRLTVLARAQQQLTQLASEDSLPTGIAEAVQLVLPTISCDILSVVGSDLQRVVRLEHGLMVSSDLAPLADMSLARYTAETGVSRVATHLAPDTDVLRGTSELCAAVRFGQRSAGVIRLLSVPDAPFDAQDLDLITIIARHAGTAVETARLFALQDLQRQRAEGAAELARVTLGAENLAHGAAELLHALDRFVPSIGKAIGVARARDGIIEYIAASGTLDVLRGHRPAGTKGVTAVAPNGKPVEFASLRDEAPAEMLDVVPDEWAFAVPLAARDRIIGVLLVTAPKPTPLLKRDRITLERLSASLALALDALLLDEEERLAREREHLLATALTTINHPIFILDRVGVRYANPAAAREYGWSQAELMDMRFEQLVVGVDAREGLNVESGVVEPGVRLSNDVHRRRDDTEFPAAVTVSPLTGHDGDLLGQVVSVRNVSQDRLLEEQLRHTEKMVALGELVAGVAHEINNPLTGISAFAQILLEEQLDAEQRESVQLIKQECDRAKGVIHDLLLFARKSDRGAEPRAEPVNVNGALEHTVRLRAYPLRIANVTVRLELDPTAPTVSGDTQKLQQVLLNVISNAEHAMHGRTERVLTLRTVRDGDTVVISAHDTGQGMSADIRRRIFEPFYSTKPPGVGTGLGLAVSYGIISAYGGTIAVDSEPDVGTTVTIVLPALAV